MEKKKNPIGSFIFGVITILLAVKFIHVTFPYLQEIITNIPEIISGNYDVPKLDNETKMTYFIWALVTLISASLI